MPMRRHGRPTQGHLGFWGPLASLYSPGREEMHPLPSPYPTQDHRATGRMAWPGPSCHSVLLSNV